VGLTQEEFKTLKTGDVLVSDYARGKVEFVRFLTPNFAQCLTLTGVEQHVTIYREELDFPKSSDEGLQV
jgi:hypothetical protein